MKTLRGLLQTAVAAAVLGGGGQALADHGGGGHGRDFGGRQEYGHRDGGREWRGYHREHGGGWQAVPFPFPFLPVPVPRILLPPVPSVRVLLPPVPCATVERARVILNVNGCRRIAQPMVHGCAAAVEVRVGIGLPWVVVGTHPSIW
jgi:hypothetical protein